ncbi:hypothetical protein K523DRAFT_368807 [Schizophyllum commune Tattone D]|nr:hypothetical protein K523DRAFT_368807 [Schizophyllum commune Tattone D]
MSATIDNEGALPHPIQQYEQLMEIRLPACVLDQDELFRCEDLRKFYADHIACADRAEFAPDEDFSLEEQQLLQNLFAPVLRQAMAVQGHVQARRDEEIVFPEVLVMVSIILSECFPSSTHEHHASAIFAVSREPGSDPDEHPAIGLRRRAELVVSRRWGTTRLDFTNDGPIVDEEFDALADGDAHSDTYGHPQQLLYSRSPNPQGPLDACVASPSTIQPLLTSALYHSLAVGASGPLVGLSYEKTCPTVYAHIAWLEEVAQEDDDLPKPHILPPLPFDLTEPLSALKLGLLLHRALSVHEWSLQTANETLPWRADICARIVLDETPLFHVDFHNSEAIARWADEVYISAVDHLQSLDIWDDMESNPSHPLTGTSDASSGSSTSSTSPSVASPLPQESASSWSDGDVLAESAQLFSRIEWTPPARPPLPQRYFILRKVVFCDARKGLPGWCTVPKESIHALAPVWFRETGTDPRPFICSDQERLLTELLDVHARHSSCFIGYMSDRVQAIVQRSLHVIFHALQAARAVCPADAEGGDVDGHMLDALEGETRCRFIWDQLIQAIADLAQVANARYRRNMTLKNPEYPGPEVYEINGDHRSDLFDLYITLLPYAQIGWEGCLAFQWHDAVFNEDPTLSAAVAAAQEEPRSVADAVSILAPFIASDSSKDDDGVEVGSPVEPKERPPWVIYGDSVFATADSRRPLDPQACAAYQHSMHVQPFPDQQPAVEACSASPGAPLLDGETGCETQDRPHIRPRPDQVDPLRSAACFPLLLCHFNALLNGWGKEKTATNQERASLVAACAFMKLFNIAHFPIFGLVTNGPVGVLSSAWNEVTTTPASLGGQVTEKIHNVIYIADEQATKVDIRDPLDVLNVATSVAYIMTEHASRLRGLFESLHQADSAYLLDKDVTPLQKARSLTVADGAWHKSQLEDQVSGVDCA